MKKDVLYTLFVFFLVWCVVLYFWFQIFKESTSSHVFFPPLFNFVILPKLFLNFFFSKSQAQFKSMEIHNSNYSAYISEFTPNTYIMAVLYDTTIRTFCFLMEISSRGTLLILV
jgi:hypothetical protein